MFGANEVHVGRGQSSVSSMKDLEIMLLYVTPKSHKLFFYRLHLQIAYTAITTAINYNCCNQAVHDLSKYCVHLLSSLADRFSRANTCVKKGKNISCQPKDGVTHWFFDFEHNHVVEFFLWNFFQTPLIFSRLAL